MKRILLLFSLIGIAGFANAQSDLSLPFMRNVFQASFFDPTVRSEHTLSIGIPILSSVSTQIIHNGFVPSSIFKKENDRLVLSPSLVPESMNERNMIFANVGLDLLHVKLKIYNWDYWFAVRQVQDLSFFYPKDLFGLAIYGNGEFVGQALDFSPLGLNLSVYREYSFGTATEVNDWVFGGRLSLLQGLSSAYFKPNTLALEIDDDMYAHTGTVRGTLYTSGIPFDEDDNPNIDRLVPDQFSLSTFRNTYLFEYLTRFRNPGIALSGGVTYKLDQRTSFTLAFSDLGFIQWSDSTNNFLLKGNHSFEGADILASFLYDREVNGDAIVDAVLDSFSDEKFAESYLVWLAPKILIRSNYKIAQRTELGLQFYTTYNRRFYPAFTLGIQQGLGRYFNLLLTGSANQRTFTNLGFGLLLKPGPMQIYVVADNYFSPVVDPLSFTNLNVRLGMNLVFGRVKTQQGLPFR